MTTHDLLRAALPAALTTALPAAALLAFAGPAAADATLFIGPDGGTGSVVVVDETGVNAPTPVAGLDGIELLALDAIGRTRLETFLPEHARLIADVPGASRVLLPAGAGSLYHYRRGLAGGGAEFGYFTVDADGVARALVARPGVGVAGDLDPFAPRVACDPSGSAVLVATTVAAGGDVLELDLATWTAIDRTPNLAPLAIAPDGLGLRDTWGVVGHAGGLLRFLRQPGAVAESVTLPGAPTWFGGAFVFSGNQLVAATTAGSGPGAALPFALGPVGPAAQLDTTPRALSGPGFLPDVVDGPYMALSHDGSVCLWCSETPASREAWTARVTLATSAALPVTSDQQFIDTLDEVGLAGAMRRISDHAIVVAVGERADPVDGGIEGIDFYLVDVPTTGAAPTLTNITLTSNDAVEPFTMGALEPTRATYRVPGTARVLMRDDGGAGGRLTVADLETGAVQVALQGAEDLIAIEPVGANFLTVTDGDLTGVDLRTVALVDPATGSATTLGNFDPTTVFDRFATHPTGWIAFGIDLGGAELVARVRGVSGFGQLLTLFPIEPGPTLGWTPGDRLLLTGSLAGPDRIGFGWGLETTSFVVPLPPQPCFVLPGA